MQQLRADCRGQHDIIMAALAADPDQLSLQAKSAIATALKCQDQLVDTAIKRHLQNPALADEFALPIYLLRCRATCF